LAAEILQKQAYSALEAMREHAINQAFETVVSMIMHNCGPLVMICTLGYAHVLDELFLAFDAAHRFSHGLRVGFATIAMLRYAQASELKSYSEFCQSIGIPTSLSELGLAGISREQWLKAAEHTITVSGTIKSLPFQVTPEQMIDNLLEMEGWRDCRRTIEI
jgi:glycerol dehydrogenase